MVSPVLLATPEAADVVREADEEEQHDDEDPDRRHALVDLAPDRPAADPLDDREGNVAAVQGQQREQVEEGEREADQAEYPEIVLDSLVQRSRGALDDPDGAGDLLPAAAVDEMGERLADLLRDEPGE